VGSRSDGWGLSGARAAALVAGACLRGGASPVMTKLGRPGFVWVGIKPWRLLAVRVIHLGYQRGGSGLGWAIPAARAARGGEHAGVRAFQGLGGIPGFGI
jgi:hypothetical protein